MPYQSNDDLPESVKGLPADAQSIFRAAFNAASEKGEDEETSMKIAWSAVKRVYAQNDDGEWVKKDAADEDEAEASARSQRGELVALLADVTEPSEAITRTIQVLRPGEFVDMHGKPVAVTPGDLDAYVANSNTRLQSTQVPVELGHPTDPGAPAAAWYKRFFRQAVDGVDWVCAEIELSSLGAKSLSDKLYKYFSANLDLGGKRVIGGGFVNRPAVGGQQPVGALAQYLTPVSAAPSESPANVFTFVSDLFKRALDFAQAELARRPQPDEATPAPSAPVPSNIQSPKGGELQMADTQNQTVPAPLTAPIPHVVLPVTQVDPALPPDQQIAQVREQARLAAEAQVREFQAMLAEERKRATEEAQAQMARRQKVAALSVQLTTGRRQFPYKAEELETILGQLTDADRDLIAPVLVKVHDAGLVEMGERGSSGPGKGHNALPAYAKPLLTAWLAKQGTVEEFFSTNPELGGAHLYDLSEFEKK